MPPPARLVAHSPDVAVPVHRNHDDRVDRLALGVGRARLEQPQVHQTGSIRIADALNSAVPDFGSVASMVSTFVATSSGKWSVMKASPGRSVSSYRTGASTAPRRETTLTRSPSATP